MLSKTPPWAKWRKAKLNWTGEATVRRRKFVRTGIRHRSQRAGIGRLVLTDKLEENKLPLIGHTGPQCPGRNQARSGRPVECATLPGKRRQKHEVTDGVSDEQTDEIVGGAAGKGIPSQDEVRSGVNGLRRGKIAEVWRRRITAFRQRERQGASAVVGGHNGQGISSEPKSGIQSTLGRELGLQLRSRPFDGL